jgi:hypothetical protein
MTKYNTRQEYTISTINNAKNREDSWMAEFEKQLTKQAVQPKRVDQSMYEQINNIINGKSKYTSVDAAVQDMQRRSGYLDYVSNKKVAEKEEVKKNSKPSLLMQHPHIEITINNYCSDTKGQQDVPSIMEKVKSIHKRDVSDDSLWDQEDLIKFVNDLNEKCKQQHHTTEDNNLGKVHFHNNKDDIDPSNQDAWHGLMPVKS